MVSAFGFLVWVGGVRPANVHAGTVGDIVQSGDDDRALHGFQDAVSGCGFPITIHIPGVVRYWGGWITVSESGRLFGRLDWLDRHREHHNPGRGIDTEIGRASCRGR